MTHIDGYSRKTALQRAPASLQSDDKSVKDAINKLKARGVKSGAKSAPPPKPDANAVATNANKAGAILERAFVKSSEKATGIVSRLSENLLGDKGVHTKLLTRLLVTDDREITKLKDQLHYSHWKASTSGTSPEDRMVTRTAILLAFAHGANLDETARLKSFLNTCDPSTRDNVLAALNKPDANATRILNHFQQGPLTVSVDGSAERGKLQNWAGQHGEDQSVKSKTDKFLADNINNPKFQKDPALTNIKDLGGKGVEPAIIVGATAVSAYTVEGIYKPLNKALRDGEPLSSDQDLLTRAATHFMSKLPDFQGIVARGGGSGWQDAARAKYVPGQVVTEHAFTSTSPDQGFPGSIQFIIESRHGKEVTDLSVATGQDGREVLFPPGAKFEVLAVETADEKFTIKKTGQQENIMFIVMREVD
jgi:hypothetical protein